jgi:hypothetical protein
MSSRATIQHTVSASEPPGAAVGDEWFNPTTNSLYKRTVINGVARWFSLNGSTSTTSVASVSSIAGAIYENSQYITSNYTISEGKNGMSAGPVTVNNGITVTVPQGSVWVIV